MTAEEIAFYIQLGRAKQVIADAERIVAETKLLIAELEGANHD